MQQPAEMDTKKEVNSTTTGVDPESECNKEFSYDTILSLGNKVRMTDKNEDNGLEIYCYVHCTTNDSPELQKCRGVVVNDKQIILQAFPYTLEYNHTESDVISQKIQLSKCKVYDAYEGSLIRLFYFDKWYICTHRKLNAFRSKWASKESFGTGFVTALEHYYSTNEEFKSRLGIEGTNSVYDKFLNTLDTNNQYMFLLTNNNENRIVCMANEYPTVYHVGTFVNGTLDLDHSCGIKVPKQHTFSSVEEMTNFVKNIDIRDMQGVICYGENNTQIKVLHKDYQELFKARGNEPSIKFRYLQVRMSKKTADMLHHLYPSKIQEFEEMENTLYEISKSIYNAYVQRFIKKRFVSVPKEDYNVIKECHKWHETDRVNNRITLEKVIKVVNEQSAINLNRIIRRFRSSKNEQETQQQNTHEQIESATTENTPAASPMTFPTDTAKVVSPLHLATPPPTSQIPIKVAI